MFGMSPTYDQGLAPRASSGNLREPILDLLEGLSGVAFKAWLAVDGNIDLLRAAFIRDPASFARSALMRWRLLTTSVVINFMPTALNRIVGASANPRFTAIAYAASTRTVVPFLTSNTAPLGTASNSTGGTDAWRVFDDGGDTIGSMNATSGWWQYEFPFAVSVDEITVRPRSDVPNQTPQNAQVQGILDDNTFGETVASMVLVPDGSTQKFTFTGASFYKRWRFFFGSVHGSTAASLIDLRFRGITLDAP